MKRLLLLFLLAACVHTRVITHVITEGQVVTHHPVGTPDSVGFLKLGDAPIGQGAVNRYGYMDPYFRDSVLAKDWSVTALNERAYCITSWSVLVQNNAIGTAIQHLDITIDSTFVIWDMKPASTTGSTATSVTYSCPFGMPSAHTHPGFTCKDDEDLTSCVKGGFSAFQCQPSAQDLQFMMYWGQPFGINICGPNQVRFFFPADYYARIWKGVRAKP